MEINQLTEIVIGCALRVHRQLGPGYLEKVYENALMIELGERGIKAQQQKPISVFYHKQCVGEFVADLFVDDRLLVEIKAVQQLAIAHEVQLVNYLTATGIENGLLLNFGPSMVPRRKFRTYRPPAKK